MSSPLFDHSLQPILDQADLGIIVTDDSGEVLYQNGAARFVLGVDMRGEQLQFPNVLPDEKGSCAINTVATDGSIRFLELQSGNVSWEEGQARLFTLKDVTAYHDELVEREREVAARDRFLAKLSHELRNPLSAVTAGFTALEQTDGNPETFAEVGDIISGQLKQLRRLLDDLLDSVRISQNRLRLAFRPVDFRTIVHDAVRGTAEKIRDGGYQFTVDVPDDPVPVRGDAQRLQQVLVNLLTNAVKHTPPGERIAVALTTNSSPQHGSNGNHPKNGEANTHAVLSVLDHGTGIDPQFLPDVFRPYRQAMQDGQLPEDGFGLGLSLAKAIMRRHRGTIELFSEGLGHGTEATISLPLTDEPLEQKTVAPPDGTVGPLSILLIEDQTALRVLTAKALTQIGHRVETAENGETGLERLRTEEFDLALVDVGLPDITGYQVVERFRASRNAEASASTTDEEHTRCKLVALTGYGKPEDRQRALSAGFDSHLTKPFDVQSFTQTIHTLFGPAQ